MTFSRGRCMVLLEFNNKKNVELLDGYYTEDGNYFIYKTTTFWYVLDVKSGSSYGRGKGYTMKKDIVKDLDFIIRQFNLYKDKYEEYYKKACASYKRLCKQAESGGK